MRCSDRESRIVEPWAASIGLNYYHLACLCKHCVNHPQLWRCAAFSLWNAKRIRYRVLIMTLFCCSFHQKDSLGLHGALTAPTLGETLKGLMSGVDFAGRHSDGRMSASGLWR
jgi:hypothetical protein